MNAPSRQERTGNVPCSPTARPWPDTEGRRGPQTRLGYPRFPQRDTLPTVIDVRDDTARTAFTHTPTVLPRPGFIRDNAFSRPHGRPDARRRATIRHGFARHRAGTGRGRVRAVASHRRTGHRHPRIAARQRPPGPPSSPVGRGPQPHRLGAHRLLLRRTPRGT